MFSTIQVHNMNILRNLPGETPHHKINHNSETTIEKTNSTFSLKKLTHKLLWENSMYFWKQKVT